MPISKKRKKKVKKKTDFNKNKINKVIKNYSKLLDNYVPLLDDLPVIEPTPYNLSKVNSLGCLSLNSLRLSSVVLPLINNKTLDNQYIIDAIKIRTNLMLALHVVLDIMPDDIEENNFLDRLKYYYALINYFYDLGIVPLIKNPPSATYFIKNKYSN